MNEQALSSLALKDVSLIGFCKYDASPIASLPYAVSIALKLSDAVLSTIADEPTPMYFQHYRTANAILDATAFQLAREIEMLGYNAFPVAASQSLGGEKRYEGFVAHKTVAVLSGLGYVGKSGLLLTREYGSKVRFATVLTDMPVERQRPLIENGCGSCTICKDACPAGAIYGELPGLNGRNFDAELCSRYMKEHFQGIGRGSVCGICIKVCPKNKLR
ncbi:MAG: epoxyqueuosine reductase [Clostridia bacterium]|nr:epoxyqueuosine reductase [Clostridia bacterium]